MPLETATFISQLVPSNPAHTDGLNNADAHMRLVKASLQATFPNFTAVALSSTQAQLDAAATAVANGVPLLADAGAFFKTNGAGGPTGIKPDAAAQTLDLVANGVVVGQAAYNGGSPQLSISGNISASGAIIGAGTVPIGGMIMWLTDTLPTGSGVWAWANGGTLSRTTYAAYYALVGTTYGAGDGSTTFNVPNMQEVVPVGKSTMGGAASPGLLTSIAPSVKTALGSLFGADTRTIATANLPPYTPSGSVAVSSTGTANTYYAPINTSLNNFPVLTANPGTAYTLPLSISSSGTFYGNAQGGSSSPLGTTQPSRAVNFIIRIG
ncbi:phage tail collar domain protein [mine drainage metagenome]|uniref:Phage tail collar domain protein n=1 Tax=mine drainage metagenome TaxID=410659 RepID=A0A1J5PBH2_9ZZZZ